MKTVLALFALALCASLSSAEISICTKNSTANKCVKTVHTCHGVVKGRCCHLMCECNKGFVFDEQRNDCVKKEDCVMKKDFIKKEGSLKKKMKGCHCDAENNEKVKHCSNCVDTCQSKGLSGARKLLHAFRKKGCACKKGYILDERDNRCVKSCGQETPSVSDDGQLKLNGEQAQIEEEESFGAGYGDDGEDDTIDGDDEKEDDEKDEDGDDNYNNQNVDENIDGSILTAEDQTEENDGNGSSLDDMIDNAKKNNNEYYSSSVSNLQDNCKSCKSNELCLLVNDSHECQKTIGYVGKVNVQKKAIFHPKLFP
ncbi:PREDICTED: anaphase-promoting complex subunit 6-like [Nicrophorus vespilloides]|uniref:Anaphase-promoting complex subunit 6-like n=1 Tax=Nicrophorus vespilloides TaxID=110193 RepID=A0ABM1MM88_NICVS|nr:PREDICTED: anaphase-promoting complex subunit 6-like [Nicrophorus vespilloides]